MGWLVGFSPGWFGLVVEKSGEEWRRVERIRGGSGENMMSKNV